MTGLLYFEEIFEARQFAEEMLLVPCPKVNTLPDDIRVLYELDLGRPVVPGEIYTLSYQFEVTNDLHKYTGDNTWSNVMVCDGIIITKTSSEGTNGYGDRVGLEVSEQFGTNVTPGQHHGRMTGSIQWKVPELYGLPENQDYRYLKVIIWSGSTKSVTAFPGLKVEPDYGHFDCIRKTPVTLQELADMLAPLMPVA